MDTQGFFSDGAAYQHLFKDKKQIF